MLILKDTEMPLPLQATELTEVEVEIKRFSLKPHFFILKRKTEMNQIHTYSGCITGFAITSVSISVTFQK